MATWALMNLSNYFALDVDPSQALPGTYNYALVLLSYLVAALGSYAFLQFATRIAELRDAGLRYSWLVIGAVAMGGGIWAMHFIGMLAHILPIPVSYDPGLTALSIVPAVLAAGVALHVVARPVVTTGRLLIGGTLMGAGIGAMHYTGMAALELNAIVRYDPTLFAASVVVAVLLSILALQARQWVSKLRFTRFMAQEVVGALILGLAVTAMHYTAMASTYCFATGGQAPPVFDRSVFAAVIALIACLVLLIAIVAVVFDRRVAQETSSHKRTTEQLLQAQKMEAVGQLTGGVAHDFNNILTIVLANADAIADDDRTPPHIARRAQRISDAGQKASELTRQLLAFSRKQVLKPEVSDLGDLVATTGQLLRRTLGEHVIVQTIASPGLWPTFVDRPQVESALINLCINARDAMSDGGRLTIETRNVALSRDYVTRLEDDVAAGDYVMLSVSDTGSGMPADVLRRVFEPFYTTKEVGKGTGLGLSMVYGFIRQSNGHIEIKSQVGQGTTVSMYFPRSDPAVAAAAAPARRRAMPRGNERILVVEDEDAVRAIVGEQLGSLGYAVKLAGNADQALELLRDNDFDLVLTDVIMPGRLNGKALAEEIQRLWPDTRIVFMSGYSENMLMRDGRLDSGVMLLAKPYVKADLARVIRNALTANGRNGFGGAALQGQA
jgi:NO-binding membrane sensor protein with MHYT domain/nitrogen-specific signal transduction histidine kinase/CheY-like chemotaxis protein